MSDTLFEDPDQLMLAMADAALILVDPASGRIERINPALCDWLGHATSDLEQGLFWDARWWQQPQLLRTLVTLTALPLTLPALEVSALTAGHETLALRMSTRAVSLNQRRLVLCTAVRSDGQTQRAVDASPAESALMDVVQTLSTVLEAHDPDSIGHQRRVADLAGTLARRLQWSPVDIQAVELAALLHDIGMLAVPARILGKLEMLTAEEVRQIQKHVQTGVDMLKHIRFPGPVIQTIAQHHERLDGSGYPAGVKGDAVLRSAQLIAMADMLDAMTRERPYQSAQRWEEALTTLEAASGVLFEAELVQACAHLFRHEGYRFPAV